MKTRVVREGDYYVIRIPESFIEEAGLDDEVEIRVIKSGVVAIGKAHDPRAGRREAAERLRAIGEDRLI